MQKAHWAHTNKTQICFVLGRNGMCPVGFLFFEVFMTDLVLRSEVLQMSTVEIARLTGKQHSNVLRDVRSMMEQIGDSNLNHKQFQEVRDERGYAKEFLLDKELTFCLLAGYNAKLRMRVIRRWMELEEQIQKNNAVLPDFGNPAEAARAWANQYEQLQLMEQQRDRAIKEKSWIGTKREATAMATASVATRKAAQMTERAERLMIDLDESSEYATVMRMNKKYGEDFAWKPLKHMSKALGHRIIKVPDKRFGHVGSYHRDVWLAVYGVDTAWEREMGRG